MPTPRDDIRNLEIFSSEELNRQTGRTAIPELGIEETASQTGLTGQIRSAREDAATASDVTEGIFERRTRGQNLSPRQRAAAKKRLSLNRRIGQADAAATTRRTSRQLATDAERGAGGLEDMIFGQQLAGLTDLANAQGQRQVREAQERAQKKANRNAMIAQGVGLVAALALSSESAKDKRGKATGLLNRLKAVRVDRWNYKGEDQEHIGPYAEEFNETFGVGKEHPEMISLVDAMGVIMGSVKELNEKVEARG